MRLFCQIISWITILAGCSPAPSGVHVEYQQRLANVIQLDHVDTITLRPLKSRHANKPSSQITLSMLELAHLSHCSLMSTIANNNNQLGKVRVPSEQLKYAIMFINDAQTCLDHSATTDEIVITKLTLALAEKKNQLSAYFEQMVFNERELAKMLLLTSQEINLEDHQEAISQALEALTTLAAIYKEIVQNNSDTTQLRDPQRITGALAKLNQNYAVSRLITSARKQIKLNQVTTQWLNNITPTKHLCQPNKSKQKAQIMSNIFNKFYLSQLQGYQSKLTKMLRDVSPHLATLWRSEPDLSQKFNIEHSDSYYQQLKKSAVDHVSWWQYFYKTCKIQP
ncbi:hypothetical protein PA25_17150 [Pseudoalteromonas sp. A25]|uniref:DUF3080 family protein n=1 Tax=Pseudoalteromonas sp. A25 TaxID=116092 RepID=UPI001260A773|nr:DUF3080 family protein [Pseudoalteromonas sp. A25]BBN81730.1 hypothetical protein PA25_17150 [Pseudoalteromonas sp. A25]